MADRISYTIDIKGINDLINRLESATKEEVIKKSLYSGALLLSRWSKENRLTGPRPQFLGVRTGRLRSSIIGSPAQKNGNVYTSKIGTNVIYGPVHEYGSSKRNIPARPFLRPALQDVNNQKNILNILTNNIKEALSNK